MAAATSLSVNSLHARIQRVGNRGSEPPPPPEKSQNTGFPSNTCPDPLKNHKVTKPVLNVGSSSASGETPFKWRFAGGTMMARFKCYLLFGSSLSPHKKTPGLDPLLQNILNPRKVWIQIRTCRMSVLIWSQTV